MVYRSCLWHRTQHRPMVNQRWQQHLWTKLTNQKHSSVYPNRASQPEWWTLMRYSRLKKKKQKRKRRRCITVLARYWISKTTYRLPDQKRSPLWCSARKSHKMALLQRQLSKWPNSSYSKATNRLSGSQQCIHRRRDRMYLWCLWLRAKTMPNCAEFPVWMTQNDSFSCWIV